MGGEGRDGEEGGGGRNARFNRHAQYSSWNVCSTEERAVCSVRTPYSGTTLLIVLSILAPHFI